MKHETFFFLSTIAFILSSPWPLPPNIKYFLSMKVITLWTFTLTEWLGDQKGKSSFCRRCGGDWSMGIPSLSLITLWYYIYTTCSYWVCSPVVVTPISNYYMWTYWSSLNSVPNTHTGSSSRASPTFSSSKNPPPVSMNLLPWTLITLFSMESAEFLEIKCNAKRFVLTCY